jgi:hypothetical protein
VRIAMVLFQFLEIIEVFGDYLRVEYLCHAFIMPSTKRNGITALSVSDQHSLALLFPLLAGSTGHRCWFGFLGPSRPVLMGRARNSRVGSAHCVTVEAQEGLQRS